MVKTFNEKMKAFSDKDFTERCATISFWALCLVVVDCSFSGGGHYLAIRSLSARILIGMLAVLFSLPVIFRDLKNQIRRPSNILVLGFCIWLLFSAVRGYCAGNRMDVLLSDMKGFAWLALVPVACAVISDRKRLNSILTCVVVGAAIQASGVLLINILCTMTTFRFEVIYRFLISTQIGSVSTVSDHIYRIFMKSSPYMIVACVIILYRQLSSPKIRGRYVLLLALYLNALLLSFTRSLYGAAAITALVSIVILLVAHPQWVRKLTVYVLAGILAFCMLVGLQEFASGANLFGFAVARTTGVMIPKSPAVRLHDALEEKFQSSSGGQSGTVQPPDISGKEEQQQEEYLRITETSDEIRATTMRELKELFCRSPILGNGLGASAPSREGVDEYFYHDMLARVGIVGLLLYVLPFGYTLAWAIRRWRSLRKWDEALAAICSMTAFWVATWFNPWMNAALGITWYAVVVAIPCIPISTEEVAA